MLRHQAELRRAQVLKPVIDREIGFAPWLWQAGFMSLPIKVAHLFIVARLQAGACCQRKALPLLV